MLFLLNTSLAKQDGDTEDINTAELMLGFEDLKVSCNHDVVGTLCKQQARGIFCLGQRFKRMICGSLNPYAVFELLSCVHDQFTHWTHCYFPSEKTLPRNFGLNY